jgi:hypothetical protein
MYQWLSFVHVGSVLVFMLAHGVHATVMWRLRWEADPAISQTVFSALTSLPALRLAGGSMIVSGFALVALLDIWDRWWVWASVAILAAIWVVMIAYSPRFYGLVSDAAAAAVAARGTDAEAAALAAFERARRAPHTVLTTVAAIGGIGLILWLMVFRPV